MGLRKFGKADRSERQELDTFAHIDRACTIGASRRLRNRSRGSGQGYRSSAQSSASGAVVRP